jgi:hypothetical protein
MNPQKWVHGFKSEPMKVNPRENGFTYGTKMSSSKLPRFLLRFDYVSWPRYATLCAILPFWPEFCKMRYLSGRLANWRKLEHFDAVLEVGNAYKSIIHLPRHHAA